MELKGTHLKILDAISNGSINASEIAEKIDIQIKIVEYLQKELAINNYLIGTFEGYYLTDKGGTALLDPKYFEKNRCGNSTIINIIRSQGDRNTLNQNSNNEEKLVAGDEIKQSGSFGVGVNKGEIKTDKLAGTINEAQQQNLAQAASEIQQLLKQLSKTYPTSTSKEKMTVVAEAVDQIETNPTLKARVINALKAGGTEAFKEAIDHPLVNILMASIEGWQDAE
ncbi:MAG: hypothetical protein ACFBSE_08145 [Prochloraceae cyanobacterium]